MSSNLKVSLHENQPVNDNMIVTHDGQMIKIPERNMIMVDQGVDWTIEIEIVVMIIDLIRDKIFPQAV